MALAGLLTLLVPALIIIFLLLFIRKRLFWRMAVRNFLRHRRHTLLATVGFVMGTVIITSSLVIGDTLGEMIESFLYDSLWEIDEAVAVQNPMGDMLFFTEEQGEELIQRISRLGGVEAVEMEISLTAAVVDTTGEQFEPSVSLHGLESDSFFARFVDEWGEVPLPDEGVLITEGVAEELLASSGDRITLFTELGNFTTVVKGIIKEELRGGEGGIFMEIDHLRRELNLTRSANLLLISNRGGVKGGMKYSDEVRGELEAILKEMRHPSGYPFKIVLDKKETVENLRGALQSVSTIFLVFGSFSIIAGLVLIVNILSLIHI